MSSQPTCQFLASQGMQTQWRSKWHQAWCPGRSHFGGEPGQPYVKKLQKWKQVLLTVPSAFWKNHGLHLNKENICICSGSIPRVWASNIICIRKNMHTYLFLCTKMIKQVECACLFWFTHEDILMFGNQGSGKPINLQLFSTHSFMKAASTSTAQ